MKKVISLFLTLVMVLTMMPAVVFAESKEDCTGGELCSHVAKIGTTHYDTLAEAIAAVPTTGIKTTVTLLKDITADSESDYVTIDGGRYVNLDMNGHTIAIASYNHGPFAVNGGTLELSGTGKVENTCEEGFYIVELYSASESQENYSVFTQGENVTLTGDWAVVNVQAIDASTNESNYGAVVNLNGRCTTDDDDDYVVYVSGNVHNNKNAAIINFGTNAKINAGNYIAGYAVVNVADGAEFTSVENCISIAAGELNINGGTFTGGNTTGTIAGAGGSIDFEKCCAIFVKQHSTNLPIIVNIKGGTFNSAVPFNQAAGQANSPQPEKITLNISGGKFLSTAISNPTVVKSADKTGFITGGLYSKTVLADYIANGYVCIDNNDEATSAEYPHIVTAATIKVEAAEKAVTKNENDNFSNDIPTENRDEITAAAKKEVVDEIIENASETSKSNIQEQITEEIVQVKDNESTKEVTLDESSKTRIDVKLESMAIGVASKKEGTQASVIGDCTITTKTATYNVKPVVTKTTTNTETGETTVETLVITNEWLSENNKVLTFTLPVPESMKGDTVLVTHIKESGEKENFNARVEIDEKSNRFITIETPEFSIYELSQQTEESAVAKIVSGGKTYYYSSLANAVSDAQNNDTITLLNDSESGTITVNKAVTFRLDINGKKLNATIHAGEGYEQLEAEEENTYTFEKKQSLPIGKCTYKQKVMMPKSGESYQLYICGKESGWFRFEAVFGGWKIAKTSAPGMVGAIQYPYLTLKNGKLTYTDRKNATVWTYKNGAFSASEKTWQQGKGFWYGLIYVPGLRKLADATYYLNTTTNGQKLSSYYVNASLYEEVVGEHQWGLAIDCKDGTHKHVCLKCGKWETEEHEFNKLTHRCICGAIERKAGTVTVEVECKSETKKKYIGSWPWGNYKDVTTYTYFIKASSTDTRVSKVEYSKDGWWYIPGAIVVSDEELKDLKIRVTDGSGVVHNYIYNGETVSAK